MGIKIGNTWSSNGQDYGTEFKTELGRMQDLITDVVEDLNKYKKNLDANAENTKITNDAIDIVDGMIRKLEHSRSNLSTSISSIKLYDGGE